MRAPTLIEFAQQFGGAYFAAEGALWRSLKVLLLKPGALTVQYLAGRRKHYVLPLRLYLTISLLVLLVVRVAGSGPVAIKGNDPATIAKENRNFALDLGAGRAGLRDGVYFCDDLPGWVCTRIQRRIDIDPKRMLVEVESLKDRFLGNLGPALFVLLPSFALWLKLAYRNRRLRYTEHLVFALHVHAFWFVALLFTLPDWGLLTTSALLAMPVYTLLAMKRCTAAALGRAAAGGPGVGVVRHDPGRGPGRGGVGQLVVVVLSAAPELDGQEPARAISAKPIDSLRLSAFAQ